MAGDARGLLRHPSTTPGLDTVGRTPTYSTIGSAQDGSQ